MNAKSISTNLNTLISRAHFNPIKNLRPENLSSALDAFEEGRLSTAVRIFEAILKRDDIISGLNLKRKKSISRLEAEIVQLENSPRARLHREVLKKFYDNLEAHNIADGNERGGLKLLISQMMEAVPMKYAVHKIEFFERNGEIKGRFIKYPLWLFENTSNKLRLLSREGDTNPGKDLDDDEWLTTCSDGIMFASSIAYLFKQLPLKDWLIYCERNGMPGIKAITDAYPGSEQWDAVCKAVSDFGAEFHAVISQGTQLDAVDISTRGQLPYPAIIERIDRLLCSLWMGGDLSTLSAKSYGSTLQGYESSIIEEQDAENINDTLNRQVDRQIIKIAFGENEEPLAKFKLRLPDYEMHKFELEIIERLSLLGLKADPLELAKRFAFPLESEVSEDEA